MKFWLWQCVSHLLAKVRRRTKPAGGPTFRPQRGAARPPTLGAERSVVRDIFLKRMVSILGPTWRRQMRNLVIALAAVSALGTASAVSSPAAAREFPYCMQGKDAGFPGDCQYSSYAECKASASGRGEDCAINPRFAYSRQQNRAWR